MSTSFQTRLIYSEGPAWIETIRSIYFQEKERDATDQELADHVAWILEQRDGQWDADKIRAYAKEHE